MMKKGIVVFMLIFLCTCTLALHGKTGQRAANLISFFSGFPADTGTDDPFDAWPLLGASLEHVFADGLAVGISVRYSRWKDYMGTHYTVLGELCGAWTFNAWSPSLNLSYHFNPSRRGMWDPYLGAGVGIHFTRFENEMTNYAPPRAAELREQSFVRGFAGIRFYPFGRSSGFMRDFAFLAQASLYFGGGFRPVVVMFGISRGF